MYPGQSKCTHYGLKIRMTTASFIYLTQTISLFWRNVRRIIPANIFSQTCSKTPVISFVSSVPSAYFYLAKQFALKQLKQPGLGS